MSKLDKIVDAVRDSEAFQQIKSRYDELDTQAKMYVNFGALGAVVFLIFLTVLIGMSKVGGLKSDINEREELIGYLQRSADQIRQLKAQQQSKSGDSDTSSPTASFVDSVLITVGIDTAKAEVGTEKPGVDEKDLHEFLIDIKLNQINLKQLTRLLFSLTEKGATRGLNVQNLMVDTKNDPNGYIDASMTLATYKAK